MNVLTFGLLISLFGSAAYSNEVSKEYKFLKTEIAAASDAAPTDIYKIRDLFNLKMKQSFTVDLNTKNKYEDAKQRVYLKNEDLAEQIENTVAVELRKSIENRNHKNLNLLVENNIEFSDVGLAEPNKTKEYNGIIQSSYASLPIKNGKARFESSLQKYFDKFSEIEFVETKVLRLFLPENKEISDEFDFPTMLQEEKKIGAFVQLDVRGINTKSQRKTDKAVLKLTISKNADDFKISKLLFEDYESFHLERQPAFKTVAKNAGFDSGKVYQRLEALRRGGYALAIEDLNNDGRLDAFVGNYGASTIWLGQANGEFKEVPMADVNKLTLAKAAAFVDFNNDGWKDLLITRFASDNLVGDVLVYRNEKGVFKEVAKAFPSDIMRDYAMPTAIADFNNDGLLDVYVGFPGERDFSAGMVAGKSLAVHGLYLNQGDFKFSDKTKNLSAGISSSIYPHGALASDINMDGQMDIVVMDDQKNISPLYINKGQAQFSLQNTNLKIMNYGYGMGIATGDFNADGYPDVVMSNATFNAQNRLDISSDFMFNSEQTHVSSKEINQGIRLFMSNKGKNFSEVTEVANLEDSGEAAGGVTVIDYDNDGLQDLYVVNGLWSGSSRDHRIDSLFAKATGLQLALQDHLLSGKGDRSPDASKSIFMKVLMQDKAKVEGETKSLSFAGYQRNRLFKNLGNGKFLEVGFLEGADSMADGYMSAVADVNRDGRPDLVLRNCDPGASDNMFNAVQIFENTLKKNKSVWITLKGTKSNSMGVGAKIFATIGKQTHYREIVANNSAMQGQVSAHFGLDSYSKVSQLKIIWPSGATDIYKDIKAGSHEFIENVRPLASNK